MDRSEMQRHAAEELKRIARVMQQIKDDADHWNRLHPNEPPIEVDMDLTADVARRKAGTPEVR